MLHRFLHNKTAVGTVTIVLIVAFMGLFAPFIAPHDPYATNILNKFAHFSKEYPLGTDNLGRCILSRMIYGIRPHSWPGCADHVRHHRSRRPDGPFSRVFSWHYGRTDHAYRGGNAVFPQSDSWFCCSCAAGHYQYRRVLANVFIKWAWYARMIRTGVMQYRDRNFVQFSRCVGTPERFILFRHLVPSIAADLAVLSSLDVGWAIYQYFHFVLPGTWCTGSYS